MRLGAAVWVCAALLLSRPGTLSAQIELDGRVIDDNGSAVAGARVELLASGREAAAGMSDETGAFRLVIARGQEYTLRARRDGYFLLERQVRIDAAQSQLVVTLNRLREVTESVDVLYSPAAIDPAEIAQESRLDNVDILQVPYPAPHDLRSSLPLFQGVVQDRNRQLHFNGGAADQANYTVDGFNISDPVTGTLEARLSIDSVQSLDLETSRLATDKGRGSAAALDIKTGMGDDRLRFSGTNFFPGVAASRGLYISKWTPRIAVSGPLRPGRAWFYNAFDSFYNVDTVRELPKGEDRTRGLTATNLSRFQVNLRPAHILTASLLANYSDLDRVGLSFLDPAETTTDRRGNFFLSALKYQAYASGFLVETGIADSRGVTRRNPQGSEPFLISPAGRRGNYFVDLARHIERQQWTTQVVFPSRAGHQLRAGLEVQRSSFDQAVARHTYHVLRGDGSLAREVGFFGDGQMGDTNLEPALYLQDRWTLRDGLTLEAGLRADHNRLLGRTGVSPRLGAAWAPGWMGGTKIAAGFGVYQEPVALERLTRHHDQASTAVFYDRDGAAAMGPVTTRFFVDRTWLRMPRSQVSSLTVERSLPGGFYGRASYLRRVGRDGLAFTSTPAMPAAGRDIGYRLENRRNDRYDAFEVSARRTFAGQYEWFGGYTWSSARSDAVIDYDLENPIFASQGAGPFDWDVPHRFLTWGWAPVPPRLLPPVLKWLLRNTNLAYLAEARSGFPFSAVTEEGVLAGRPNTWRLPSYFSLNLHLEKRFGVLNTLWAWRFGFNNITNNGNPDVVNNNVDSPDFLTFGRGQRRAFSVRLRFLGRR